MVRSPVKIPCCLVTEKQLIRKILHHYVCSLWTLTVCADMVVPTLPCKKGMAKVEEMQRRWQGLTKL